MKDSLFFMLTLLMVTTPIKSQDKVIEIIATSDVHGALYPKDFVSGKDSIPSMASLSTYIKQQHNNPDKDVIVLDNGDLLQGDPIVYYYNYIDTTTKHFAANALNYLEFDAMSVGNHDLEGGPDVYNRFREQTEFPLLSANIIDTRTQKTYFEPYTIIEKSGKKIAILGLTTPKVPSWLPNSLIENMEFQDMVESAKHWVSIINKKENPDVLIGLFHAGTDNSYNNDEHDMFMSENATEMVAKEVEGFDVVIAGHDHQGHNYTITNNFGKKVLIIAPTSRLRDFASITISFDKDNNKTVNGKIYLTSSVPIDYGYIRIFQPYITDLEEYLNEPIGIISNDMLSTEALFGDDAMSNLIHEVQLHYSKADVSFAAPLSLNSQILAGTQYRKDLFKLYKYDNYLYCMELSGQEIKDYLEYSYWHWFNQMENEDDYLLRYKLDENGNTTSTFYPQTEAQIYNFDSAEGITYTVDVSKDKGNRVNIISFNDGRPFKLDEKYKVAITSYRGSGAGNLLTDGAGIPADKLTERIIYSSTEDIKYFLAEWIKEHTPVSRNKKTNWTIIPNEWYDNRIEKEKAMFIPKSLSH